MNVDVTFTPEEIETSEITEKSILVVDILRATSTITTAIANGATFIIPVNSPQEAFTLSQKYDGKVKIGGEVGGKRIDGFHLGNSPSEYTPSAIKDSPIVFRTTNGTRAINACKSSHHLAIGSFLNQTAVCHHLSQLGDDIIIACSGKKGRLGLEDTVFAGACVYNLSQMANIDKTDSAIASEILYKSFKSNILKMLQDCEHGRYLISIGLGDDLALCAKVDTTKVVPIYKNGKIILKQ